MEFKNFWEKIDGNNLIVGVGSCILWALLSLIKPNPLYFPPNDANSAFPHAEKSTLPTVVIGVILVLISAVVIALAYFLQKKYPTFFNHFRLFTLIWGLAASEGIAGVCVAIFKNMVGRPRPDLYAVCGSNVTSDPSSCPKLSKSEFYDQFRSWPSGHSQTAMSGFLYIGLFVQSFFVSKQMWTSFVGSLFIIFAIYCGSTRIRDYKHHPDDVLAGFFIGFVFTYMIWSRIKKDIFSNDESKEEIDQNDQMSETTIPINTEA